MSDKKNSMVTDLTEGNVTSLLLRFTVPMLLSNALQAIYNMVDMIVVGQVMGGVGLSAVSIGGEILHMLTFMAIGFSNAGQVIISQQVGANRMDEVKKSIGNLFTFLLGASIVLSVICLMLRENLISWLNTPAEAYQLTMDYTVTCILGLVFIYGYNIVSAILRGMGDSKRPFIFIAVAAVLNIILDIIFVAFCGMEAFGAALATVIGQGVSFVASLVYLYVKRDSFAFDFKWKSFMLEGHTIRRLLGLGIPMSIQAAAISVSKVILSSWVNAYGVTASAVGGLLNKVATIYNVITMSFTAAGSAMAGQNIGARKYDRVTEILRTVLTISLVIAVVCSAAFYFWREPICGLFTSDQEVLAATSMIVLPVILNFFGAATRSGAFTIINGSGHSRLNLIVAVIDGVIARIGVAALLGFGLQMGCYGFWMGDAIAGFMPFLIGTVFYLSGHWKTLEE